MKYTMDNIKISTHAKERYSLRIMDKDSKTDVAIFIAQHEQKIKEDIFKMIEYGTLLFSGKSPHEFNKQPVDIFLNGTWIIIVDIAKCNVVTLYSIDLGLGSDFNQEYINRILEKLNEAKEQFNTTSISINEQNSTYKTLIEDNVKQINEYKQIINLLEKQNQAYSDTIDSLETNKIIAEKDIREIIGVLIGKKIF